MKKQVLSLALSATMLASMLPKPAFAADNTITFPDMPNDWSTQALQNAINTALNELMDDGTVDEIIAKYISAE